jgi:PAS domain S-box-containing protein
MIVISRRPSMPTTAKHLKVKPDWLLAAIIEASLDAIIAIDAHGLVTQFNPAAESMFCHTRAQTLGRELADIIIPERFRALHRAGMQRYLETGEGPALRKRLELPALRADGTEFPAELVIAPALDANGKVTFIGFVRDLTDQKLAEAARTMNATLQEQNRAMAETSRLKSEFLANMSHELRTPLNAIIGFSSLLLDGSVVPDSQEAHEFLGDILRSGQQLLVLINDVLDLARVEAGDIDFRPQTVDLPKLLQNLVSLQRPAAQDAKITLTLEVDPALKEIQTDPLRLGQIVNNYLSNAVKFTPKGGHVTVRALPEDEDSLRIEVEDDGIGIAAEDISRLFVQFQQLEGGATKKYRGTGLGLALTCRLVEGQGGKVGVQSEVGKGSLFFAVLPRTLTRPTRSAIPAP